MSDTKYICPNCGRTLVFDTDINEDFFASFNSMSTWYDIWCSDCGATTRWKENMEWPAKDKWQIPRLSKKT